MIFIRERILVFFFPLLLSLPFINRAYFVDDSYFVEIAQWLKDNPELPYHFKADDAGLQNRGWEEDGFVRMVNPLLHHYYLAFLVKLFGEKEWVLRLGCVLLVCVSALFLLGLARRFTDHPVLSTCLLLATPVYWLTTHSLLIDSTMGALFIGGLYYFIRGFEKDSVPFLIVSGFLMGLAIVTKYTALLILPVTFLWLCCYRKKLRRHGLAFVPWAIGLGILLIYSLYTMILYGAPHILAASARMVKPFGPIKYLVFFIFLSGSLIVPLVSWGMLGFRRLIVNALLIFAMTFFFSSPMGGFSIVQGFLLSLWFVTTFLFCADYLLLRSQWSKPRDLFLLGWFLSFVGMMAVVMGWVAVRYYVIVAPAVVFMAVRMIEIKWPTQAARFLHGIFIGVLILGASLAYADYKQAEPSRDLVQVLKNKGYEGGERHFYLGDSFTMSYLRGQGWIPCFPDTSFQIGDWILAKEVTMPLVWFIKRPYVYREIEQFEYPSHFPFKVMDFQGSAGFYASVWGGLPFTISWGPWERFRLFEVVGHKDNSQ